MRFHVRGSQPEAHPAVSLIAVFQHQIRPSPRSVSRDEWLAPGKAHLKNEKALTRMRDHVAAERRALPWVKVGKEYVFDAPEGKRTLAELPAAGQEPNAV